MKINVNLEANSYDIHIGKGILAQINQLILKHHQVCIISDEGVPKEYLNTVTKQFLHPYEYIIKQGEDSKSMKCYQGICEFLLRNNFTRQDAIIALGGGVVGDLSGFVAATYMRGIAFYQIPTTTLAQIDSSIGGKVAINLGDIKNIVGAFYQPKGVIIDLDTLKTLPLRHYNNGLVEALKAGLIKDEKLFQLFEEVDYQQHIEEIIIRAIEVKKAIVEIDEKEEHERKLLNFGHTIGHAIESYYGLSKYYHGECVAMGMLYFINNEDIKKRIYSIYKKLNIPIKTTYDADKLFKILTSDKKVSEDLIDIISVSKIGKATIETIKLNECKERL